MKRQKYAKIFLLCFLICLSTVTAAWAVVEAPLEVYVGDYANVLSEETEQLIIEENERLEAAVGAQIVVVTVDFLDGMEIEDYAYTIFNEWGIGDAEQNNGLLLLLVIGEETYWAMQGDGIYRHLTSGVLDEYLYGYLEPDFAIGDYDAGTAKVFQAFVEWYDDYYQLTGNEVSSNAAAGTNVYEENKDDDGNGFLTLIILLIVLVLIISLIRRNKDRENKKNGRNYHDNDDYPEYPNMSGGSLNTGRNFRPYVYPKTSSAKPKTTAKPPSFGGGVSRGGGAGRNSASGLGRSIGKSIGSNIGRSFGGGRSRGGGAGRR